MKSISTLATILMSLTMVIGIFVVASAGEGGLPEFKATWERWDEPVNEGKTVRTWTWGPHPISPVLEEPYEQSPENRRDVQYFDKSRMEVAGDNPVNPIWDVTNGLLVNELITGQMQVGDHLFIPKTPSEANVAGDQDSPNGPAYATFLNLREPVAEATGDLTNQRINRAGDISTDSTLNSQNIRYVKYFEWDKDGGHNVAAPFWEFLNSSGVIYQDGEYVDGKLFPQTYYASGLPITEAYWTDVEVAGQEKLVLIQCFERRCLTYTPSNRKDWQVENNNVGQHYLHWRYNTPVSSSIAFELHYSNGNSDLYKGFPDGSGQFQLKLTDDTNDKDLAPGWWPNGSQVAFWSNKNGSPGIWNTETGGDVVSFLEKLADNAADNPSLDWSMESVLEPTVAYVCNTTNVCLFTLTENGAIRSQLTNFPTNSTGKITNLNFSFDGLKLAFNYQSSSTANNDIYLYDFSGSGSLIQVTNDPNRDDISPTWAPDSTMLAFASDTLLDGRYAIWTVSLNGSNLKQLTDGGGSGSDETPVWSPKDSTIAFVRFQANSSNTVVGNILTVQSDGSGLTEMTASMENTHEGPDWSANGDQLAYWADPGGSANIFVMDSSGKDLKQITNFTAEIGQAMNPTWSPLPPLIP